MTDVLSNRSKQSENQVKVVGKKDEHGDNESEDKNYLNGMKVGPAQKENVEGKLIEELNDPLAFWSTWSNRRHKCDQEQLTGKNMGCNCFEGLGSVM